MKGPKQNLIFFPFNSFDEWAQGDGFSGIKIYQNRSGSKGGRKQQTTSE
jgi:hypothetical protein